MYNSLKENLVFQNTATFKTVYQPAYTMSQLQMNDFIEISIVVDGSGVHRILSEAYECREGDLFVIGSGVPHAYFAANEREDITVMSLAFYPSNTLQQPFSQPESPHYCCGIFRDKIPFSSAMLNHQVMDKVKASYHAIAEEVIEKKLAWREAVMSELMLLLILLGRYINQADTVLIKRPKEWKIVSAAIREILENFGDNSMTLESIAAKLYISKSHLSRMFRKVTGESFMEYVRKIRIDHACDLLRSTDLTNAEIVDRCGAKDIPSFYRLFKAYTGMTPHQYRTSKRPNKGDSIMSIYLEISENLQKGRFKKVGELVQSAIDAGSTASEIMNEGLLAGMNIIGEKFKNGEVYVPQVLVAARAMNTGMQVLKPLLASDGVKAAGKVCIGTVQGDLHDIGKNLVKMMMEGKGLEVIDLGTDVSPEAFVEAAIEQNCQIICCSALLTTTMDVMADVVKAVDAAGIHDKVKVMIGGAPVTDEFRNSIGADIYTSDAASAAEAAAAACAQA